MLADRLEQFIDDYCIRGDRHVVEGQTHHSTLSVRAFRQAFNEYIGRNVPLHDVDAAMQEMGFCKRNRFYYTTSPRKQVCVCIYLDTDQPRTINCVSSEYSFFHPKCVTRQSQISGTLRRPAIVL